METKSTLSSLCWLFEVSERLVRGVDALVTTRGKNFGLAAGVSLSSKLMIRRQLFDSTARSSCGSRAKGTQSQTMRDKGLARAGRVEISNSRDFAVGGSKGFGSLWAFPLRIVSRNE